MAMIYYNKKMQKNIKKGKRTQDEIQRKPNADLSESSPSGITKDRLPLPAKSCVKCCLPGSSLETQGLRFLLGCWSCRYYLSGMYQNSRLPQGKQMFIINHLVGKAV